MWARTAGLAARRASVERRSVEGDMAGVRGRKSGDLRRLERSKGKGG